MVRVHCVSTTQENQMKPLKMSKLFKLKRNSTKVLCFICHVLISLSSSKKKGLILQLLGIQLQKGKYPQKDYCLPFNIPLCFQHLMTFKFLIAVSVSIFCAKFDSSPIKKLPLFQNIIVSPIQSKPNSINS